MAYVGNSPARGEWRKLTDISGSFNGSTTTFTTSVPPGTSQYYVTAATPNQLIISLGGVIQEPGVDYTVSTNSITFTTAPAAGLSFFGILAGDALNVSTIGDGTITDAKIAANAEIAVSKLADGTARQLLQTDAAGTGVEWASNIDVPGTLDVTGIGTFDAATRGAVTALTDASTIAVNFALSNHFSVTLGGNRTLGNPTNMVAGQSGAIWITQDGTGGRTLAYDSYWDFSGGTAPTVTSTAGAVSCLLYAVQSSTRITTQLLTNLS